MTTETGNPNRSKKAGGLQFGIWISIGMAGVLVVLGLVSGWMGYQALGQGGNHLADLGNFGSYLQGTVASFWALAGVFLILVAFLVQKQQLQYQQEELELTRADLEEQKAHLETQERSSKRQNFETSFFQLLSLQNQITSQMRQARRSQFNAADTDWLEGRVCFSFWYNNLRNEFEGYQQMASRTGQDVDLEKCYTAFYKHHQEDLGHYFRTLYHLIKLVKLSDVVVEYKDKRRYTSLVRAQLSAYELALLFYNGLSKFGKEFKPWIEEFGLLEHLDRENMLLDRLHGRLYDSMAFQ